MGKYFNILAKQAGLTDEDINSYLAPAPTPAQPGTDKPAPAELLGKKPDVVSPFPTPAPVSQSFDNYNPGMGYYNDQHKGVDFGTREGDAMTNPIGGMVRSNEWDPIYGYRFQTEGLNQQEYNDLSKEDFINGKKGEDVVAMSHLQGLAINPATGKAYQPGEYVATGSAKLKAGNTGNSTAEHTDIESFPQGSQGDYSKYRDFMKEYRMKKLLGLL